MANPERLNMPDGNGSPEDFDATSSAATAVAERPQSNPEPAFEIKPGVLKNPNLTPEQHQALRNYQQRLRDNAPTETQRNAFETRMHEPLRMVDPNTGQEITIKRMGGGADRSSEDDFIRDMMARGMSEDEARARIADLQERQRRETESLNRMRLGDVSSEQMQGLLHVQESAERQAISMMHKVSIWLKEDEDATREKMVRQEFPPNTNMSDPRVQARLQELKLGQKPDSRLFVRVREEAERVIRLIEQNPELEFRSGALQELYGAIENGASEYPELVYEVKNMIESRSMDRASVLAAKYKGGKEWGPTLGGFLPEYHSAYYLPGVQAMSRMIGEATEEGNIAQTEGQYYRGMVWRYEYNQGIPGSRRLLKTDERDYIINPNNPEYRLSQGDLQAELKIRLIRMKKEDDRDDHRTAEIVKRNSGGLAVDSTQLSDDVLAYAFTEIQKSTEGLGGKLILSADDIANRLLSVDRQGRLVGVSPTKDRFQGMSLSIRPEQRDQFIKAVNFANRAYDIAHQKAIITGLTMDATGPVLKQRGEVMQDGKVIKYNKLALPEHVWLTIPDRIDAVKLFKETGDQVTDLNKRIASLQADITKKPEEAAKFRVGIDEARRRIGELQQMQLQCGLVDQNGNPVELSDAERANREQAISKLLFRGLEGTRVDLRNLHNLTEPQRLILNRVRSSPGFLISSAWNLAYRDYFHNHMDDIDVDASRVRSEVREVGGLMWLNVYLSQNTHRNPGDAAELRKDVFLGAVSPKRAAGRESIDDVVSHWGDDYAVVARHESDRLVGAAAIKSAFYEGEHRLLSNFAAILDPKKFIDTFKEQMREYMESGELRAVTSSWAESLMYFNTHSLKKYGYSRNLNMEEVYAMMSGLVTGRAINTATSERIKGRLYGSWLTRNMRYFYSKGNKVGALMAFFQEFFKQIIQGK